MSEYICDLNNTENVDLEDIVYDQLSNELEEKRMNNLERKVKQMNIIAACARAVHGDYGELPSEIIDLCYQVKSFMIEDLPYNFQHNEEREL